MSGPLSRSPVLEYWGFQESFRSAEDDCFGAIPRGLMQEWLDNKGHAQKWTLGRFTHVLGGVSSQT